MIGGVEQLSASSTVPLSPGERIPLHYRDRATGEIRREVVPAEAWVRWLYGTRPGRLCGRALFGLSLVSRMTGWWQSSRWSRRHIHRFAACYGIDLGELADPVDELRSFNAFFTRRLKPGLRPFAASPDALCSPADGRALVFPALKDGVNFPLKGTRVSPADLLADAPLADRYRNGAALVVRLAPADYHRFHFFDDAQAQRARLIPGRRDSVNPIALATRPELFATNKRAVTLLETERFGSVAQVEIGAFGVASIVQTYTAGPVRRGQEKGFFQFGGSTVVLLLEPGIVVFDSDLVRDSATGLEVWVRTGEKLGVATRR